MNMKAFVTVFFAGLGMVALSAIGVLVSWAASAGLYSIGLWPLGALVTLAAIAASLGWAVLVLGWLWASFAALVEGGTE